MEQLKGDFPANDVLATLMREIETLKQGQFQAQQNYENLKSELEKIKLQHETQMETIERHFENKLRTVNTAVDNKLCCAELELQERMELKEISIVAQFKDRFKVVEESLMKISGQTSHVIPRADTELAGKSSTEISAVHLQVTCVICGNDVIGVRFVCLQCTTVQDVSLCQRCVETGSVHHCHVMLRLAEPCSPEQKEMLAPLAVQFRNVPLATSDVAASGQHSSYCDGCRTTIVGFRFHCVVCEDFDLCELCERERHHRQHWMLRLPWSKRSAILENAIVNTRNICKK